MRTINLILDELWFTKDKLNTICSKCNCCNWCWGKGGINFELLMKSLPLICISTTFIFITIELFIL